MSRLEVKTEDGKTWLYDKVGNMSCSFSSPKEKGIAKRQLAEAAYYKEFPFGMGRLFMRIAEATSSGKPFSEDLQKEISRRIKIFAEFGIKLNERGAERA